MKKLVVVAIIIIVLIIAAGSGGSKRSTTVRPTPRPTATPRPQTFTVRYLVEGTARRVSLTIENADGGTEQYDKSVPWETTFQGKRGAFLYIAAQNDGQSGTVETSIWVNGKREKYAQSEAAYGIASVSMSLPY